jgi:phosphatidylserine/phosphatidylglycerophosphate/cardiolipin synthase-like enzyme
VDELDHAKRSILVQAHSFTSAPIAKALVDAKRRSLDVEILLDKGQQTEKYSSADFVKHAGIPTLIDAVYATAQNKVVEIEGETVLTGSFNFTKSAEEHNAENRLVIHDKAIAEKYQRNWELHSGHSESYAGKRGTVRNPAGTFFSE